MSDFKRILIAVDSSTCSMRAAKKGFALANQLKATVALLYVINKRKETVSADLGITPEESQTILLKRAEETMVQLIRMYDGEEEVLRFTPEGIPQDEIIATSIQWDADLIVMGTHGHTGLMHLVMGSVTEHVLHHAKCPVMVVSLKSE